MASGTELMRSGAGLAFIGGLQWLSPGPTGRARTRAGSCAAGRRSAPGTPGSGWPSSPLAWGGPDRGRGGRQRRGAGQPPIWTVDRPARRMVGQPSAALLRQGWPCLGAVVAWSRPALALTRVLHRACLGSLAVYTQALVGSSTRRDDNGKREIDF